MSAGEEGEQLREKSKNMVQTALFFQARMVRNKKILLFDRLWN